MSAPVSLGVPEAATQPPPAAHPPKNIAEAAKQFEALMVAQLLKEARGDEGGWFGSGEDNASATASGLAEEQFAQALAQSGGLGLGSQIASSLAQSK